MLQWEDVTAYRQIDKDRTPTSWHLRVDGIIRIALVSRHIHVPGYWVMSCSPWFDLHPIGVSTEPLDKMQDAAIRLVRDKLGLAYRTLDNMTGV